MDGRTDVGAGGQDPSHGRGDLDEETSESSGQTTTKGKQAMKGPVDRDAGDEGASGQGRRR
jgi:hypothetical protein